MAKEYVLWGIPKGLTDHIDDKILLSNGRSMEDVEKVKKLATADGFHSFRVQIIDLEKPFNASQAMTKAIQKKA